MTLKEAQSNFFTFYFKLLGILVFWIFGVWYRKKTHIFLITNGKFYSWKVFHLLDINKNMPGYVSNNHNQTYTVRFRNYNTQNCFHVQKAQSIQPKFGIYIFGAMIFQIKQKTKFWKVDCAPLIIFTLMLSPDNRTKYLYKVSKLTFSLPLFGFAMKNAIKWVQTSLVSV